MLANDFDAFADEVIQRGGWRAKASRDVSRKIVECVVLEWPLTDWPELPRRHQRHAGQVNVKKLRARVMERYEEECGCGILTAILISLLVNVIVRVVIWLVFRDEELVGMHHAEIERWCNELEERL